MLRSSTRVHLGERGQASLLMLGVVTLLLGLAVVLFAFGKALGSKGRHQRAADLAAVSAGQVMRELYPRLFEPPVLANGLPNLRHLPLPVYLALARRAAVRGARGNGVGVSGADVSFPGGGFAPTRVAVRVRGVVRVRTRLGDGPRGGRAGEEVPVRARAAADIAPDVGAEFGMPAFGSGGGYDGPLAYRMGKPMRYLSSAL
jgi:Putative Flp pilus-assembly TadE/G-like